jgi:hypothetical protein
MIPESRNQFIVALAIVAGLVIVAVAMLVVVKLDPALAGPLGIGTAIGTIIGALANALAAPSGIGRVISSALNPGQKTENTNAKSPP